MKNKKILILLAALFLTPAGIRAQEAQTQQASQTAAAPQEAQETNAAQIPQEIQAEQPLQNEQRNEMQPASEIRVERAMIKIETPEIKIEVPAVTQTPIPVQTPVPEETEKTDEEIKNPEKLENSLYFSTRFEFEAAKVLNLFSKDSYSTEEFGLSAEFGYMFNKLFVSGSVSFLPEFIGGGASFATRAQPNEKIQIITGGTGGYWEEEKRKFFGGVFAKAIFGRKQCCEIQNRVLLGYGDINGKKHLAAAYEIGLGFTIKKR